MAARTRALGPRGDCAAPGAGGHSTARECPVLGRESGRFGAPTYRSTGAYWSGRPGAVKKGEWLPSASLAETALSRLKTLFGGQLQARNFAAQVAKTDIRCATLEYHDAAG